MNIKIHPVYGGTDIKAQIRSLAKGNHIIVGTPGRVIDLIKRNEIVVIYLVEPIKDNIIYDYIDQKCFKETIIFEHLKSYELMNCEDIKI